MRRSQIIHEFGLVAEALPVCLAGILLNVAGRQISEHFGGPFVDMTGTAFTALILGPWWAAAVASATTIVNGSFFENYFPFGVVNITGALVWGYLARAADLRNTVFAEGRGNIRSFILWTLILAIAGGIACGLASTVLKVVLYPELQRPFIYGPLYLSTQATLEQWLGSRPPEVLTLLTVDLIRDLEDKLIVVPIAMVLVRLTQIAPTFGRMSLETTRLDRLHTDILSVFVFGLTYSAFIFLAQMTRPVITVAGAAREIAWLTNPMMVVLLYAPLVIALIAFRFLTYRATDPVPRKIHAIYHQRREATRHLLEAGGKWTSFARSTATQALGTSVSIWPFRHLIDPILGVPFALGAVVFVLGGFLVLARVFYSMLQRAMQKIEVVHQWLEVGGGSGASAEIVRLMQNLFGPYFHTPEPHVARRNSLVYSLGFTIRTQRGRIEELLFGRGEDAVGDRVAVLATIEEPRALHPSVLHDLMELTTDTGAGMVALSSSTVHVGDNDVIEWLRALRRAGTEVLLFDWGDLALGSSATVLGGKPEAQMRRARARALALASAQDERFVMEESDRVKWLAKRALPSLQSVIKRLPRSSIVFDLGSGYGRHTIAALEAGHEVMAVDWKHAVCNRLREDIKTMPAVNGRANVVDGDLIDVSADTSGLADLVICTGVLQHARSVEDLAARLRHIADLAGQPAALVYIEMLFDMRFDGEVPSDGRMQISHPEFETLLRSIFPTSEWAVQRTHGPMHQKQCYDQGARSFEPPSRTVESTAAEYLIRRLQ